jgi:ubiquinol-cytochrome c reductase cytochrome b subunit
MGDLRHHQILDRPRNAPARTAFGVAIIAMAGDLFAAGADDVIAYNLDIPLIPLVWSLRIGFFVLPVIAFIVTRHICRAMQRSDRQKLRAGTEYGIAVEPGGGFAPVSRPVPEELRAVLEAHRPEHLIAPIPHHLVPLPTPRRIRAQIRARLNHFYTLDRLETPYGKGQMVLAEFNPPERRDGSVWPGDGGGGNGDRTREHAGAHGANGHDVRAAADHGAAGERPDRREEGGG